MPAVFNARHATVWAKHMKDPFGIFRCQEFHITDDCQVREVGRQSKSLETAETRGYTITVEAAGVHSLTKRCYFLIVFIDSENVKVGLLHERVDE